MNIKKFFRGTALTLVTIFSFQPTYTSETDVKQAEVSQNNEAPAEVLPKEEIPAPTVEQTLKPDPEPDPPKKKQVMEVSKEEYELLARLAHSEAGNDGIASQIGVVNVVLNRVKSKEFPNSIKGVIYQKHQFDVVVNGSINQKPDKQNYEAVDRVLAGENNVSDCVYFWATWVDRNSSMWKFTVRYQYGQTVFAGRIK